MAQGFAVGSETASDLCRFSFENYFRNPSILDWLGWAYSTVVVRPVCIRDAGVRFSIGPPEPIGTSGRRGFDSPLVHWPTSNYRDIRKAGVPPIFSPQSGATKSRVLDAITKSAIWFASGDSPRVHREM